MKIAARVDNTAGSHQVTVQTEGNARSLSIPPKPEGPGSGVSGGELLFLALATCYCNDIYREAAKRGIPVERVDVVVEGEFSGVPGGPAQNITYHARVTAQAGDDEIRDLIAHTDRVAEIHNTLRAGASVTLGRIEPVSVKSNA